MPSLADKSDKQPTEVFRVNTQGVLNVVENLTSEQVLIFASTKEVYDICEAYSLSRMIAESYIDFFAQINCFRAGIFRLSTTYVSPTNGSSFVNYFVKSVKEGIELSLLM